MILKLRGIQKEYPNSRGRALRGISLKLNKGEILALQGESGSGKSTLLKIIAGIETADKGSMEFLNEKLPIQEGYLISEHKGIRMIDQDSSLPENISIRDALNKRLYGSTKSWIKQRISEVSNLCQLKTLLDRNMDEISGGQRQRAALALAIADEPEILLLDEAFTSLDFSLKRDIQREWIRVIRESGISSIMVSHDPRDSLMFADRICIIQKGKINSKGKAKDIYENPKDLYAAELFGPVTELSQGGKKIYLRPENIKFKNSGGKVKVKIEEEYYTGNGYLYVANSSKKSYQVFSAKKMDKNSYFLDW